MVEPNTANLRICLLNVNSLLAGINLQQLIDSQCSKLYSTVIIENQFDVTAVSETWLDPSITDELIW